MALVRTAKKLLFEIDHATPGSFCADACCRVRNKWALPSIASLMGKP